MLFTAPIEATLTVVIDPSTPSILTDKMLITSLKKRGPLTIEALAAESGMSWAQMFSAVDRLSRAGTVSLRRIGSSVPGGLSSSRTVLACVIHDNPTSPHTPNGRVGSPFG